MIVRIARVKVGNRQAPFANQDPALKSGVLAFVRPEYDFTAPIHRWLQWPNGRHIRISAYPDIPSRIS